MLSNINDFVFYPYETDFIEQFSKDQANTFTTLGNGWSLFDKQEVYNIMMTVIKLYYFKTHSMVLISCGRKVPFPDQLRLLAEQIKVPRYIRDIAREFCRPMIFNNTIYLPDIVYEGPAGLTGADLFSSVKDSLMKWEYTINRIGCDIVDIETESPAPVPISFYDSVSQEIWMAKQLPAWRLEAFLYLRHLKYRYFDGIELLFEEGASAIQKKKGKGNANKEDQPFIDEPQLFNMRKTGRKVGGFAGFIVSTINVNRNIGFIPPCLRFATLDEEHFSKTPPRSRRASELSEDNNQSRGEYQQKRRPSIHLAGEKLSIMSKRGKSKLTKKTMLD